MNNIFVSKLEEYTTESTLVSHFSTYGYINEIELSTLPSGKCKGYAKLTTFDPHVYRFILSTDHFINGKKIKVEPFFKKNAELAEKDKDTINRRVCVFGVPKNFNSRRLREAFIANFGENIENGYVRKNNSNKFNYGFITFLDVETATKALKQKFIEFGQNEGRLEIRKFKSKGVGSTKNKKKKKSKIYFNTNYLKIYGDGLLNKIFEEKQDIHQKEQNRSQRGQVRSNHHKNRVVGPDIPKFMPREYLKIYLKKILERNPHINKLSRDEIPTLELFYYNYSEKNRFRKTTYNYDSISARFAKRIQKNHSVENLLFRKSSSNLRKELYHPRKFDGPSQAEYQHKRDTLEGSQWKWY